MLPCYLAEDLGNDSVIGGGYKNHCMYDDDMFLWYDSDLCMRALCMVFIPPRAKLVTVFPQVDC